MNTFKIGDRIGRATMMSRHEWNRKVVPLYFDSDREHDFGVVSDVTQKGQVSVTWDNAWINQTHFNKLYSPDELMHEEECRAILNALEEEFTAVEAKVRVKIAEAATAIEEANKLANTTGRDLHDMHESTRPLYRAMDNAGWSTSSFDC